MNGELGLLTLIEARAFRDLAKAAEWLAIPVDVLTLKDEPVPQRTEWQRIGDKIKAAFPFG